MNDETVAKVTVALANASAETLGEVLTESGALEQRWTEVVAERKRTGKPELFVNTFYRWSRENPPSADERTYLSTPEVMDLQWQRWLLYWAAGLYDVAVADGESAAQTLGTVVDP